MADHSRQANGTPDPPVARISREILACDGFGLVRYHVGSDEFWRDREAVGPRQGRTVALAYPDASAAFGMVDLATDRVAAIVETLERGLIGPEVVTFTRDATLAIPADVGLAFLNHVDLPVSWRAGADRAIARHFGLCRDPARGAWVRSPSLDTVPEPSGRAMLGSGGLSTEPPANPLAAGIGSDLSVDIPSGDEAATPSFR